MARRSSGAHGRTSSAPLIVVRWVSGLVLVLCLLALGVFGFQYWYQSDAYSKLSAALSVSDKAPSELTLSDLSVDWSYLAGINPDVVGWIYVPGTPINYPVVKGSDNQEYLHKAFDGSEGFLSSKGTIFMEAGNSLDLSDRNLVLYGHHMRDGSMFACTDDWKDQAEFDKHRDLFFLSPEGNYHLRTFSRFNTSGSEAVVRTSFVDDADFASYVDDKASRSLVSASDVPAASVSQMFLLSTCEYTRNDGRAITCASVVETTNPNDPYVKAGTSTSLALTEDELSALGSLG